MSRSHSVASLSDLSVGGLGLVRTLVATLAICAAGAAVGVVAGTSPAHETSIGTRI